jgi:hypothetical protein
MNLVFVPDNIPKREPMLTREKAAAYISQLGLPITKSRLAKLAIAGDGPEYRIWGNRAVYTPNALLEWADKRMGEPVFNTSQIKE